MEDWNKKDDTIKTIKEVMLGWDITDYGMDDFENLGATLFTLRNGSLEDDTVGVPYAEKLIVLRRTKTS